MRTALSGGNMRIGWLFGACSILSIISGCVLALSDGGNGLGRTDNDGVGCRYTDTYLPGCKPSPDKEFKVGSADECRDKCKEGKELKGCRFWTYVNSWKGCQLRSGKVTRVPKAFSVDGHRRNRDYVSGSTLSCERAELLEEPGRLGHQRKLKDNQVCKYTGVVLLVGDNTNATTNETCGLPHLHGGLGIDTQSADECRDKCLKEPFCYYWSRVDWWEDDCYLWPEGKVTKGQYGQKPTAVLESGSFGVECTFPADCVWDITRWEPCNATCGYGTQVGTRKILAHPQNGGKDCDGPTTIERSCKRHCQDYPVTVGRSLILSQSPIRSRPLSEVGPNGNLAFTEYVNRIREILEDLNCNGTITELEMLQICGRTGESLLKGRTENQTGLLEKACPMADFMTSPKGIGNYRRLCEDKLWNDSKGLSFNDFDDEIHCKGHRPSQFIWEGAVCDGRLDCIDRSDEAGCNGTNDEQDADLLAILKPLRRQPQIDTKMWRANPDQSPTSPRKDCGDEIAIGDDCLPEEDLCSTRAAQRWGKTAFEHPDHLTLCQNYSFWRPATTSGTNNRPDRRVPVFPEVPVFGEELFPCTGNFPGFYTYTNYSWGNVETFDNCKKVAHCPDLSDVKCPPEDCKENIHFRCEDNSGCIHNSLVCDGHEQCPDGSDEEVDCNNCPKAIGHPPRPASQKWAANVKCFHRYTNRSICAIPCDGRDDLCQGFSDERDCGEVMTWGQRVVVTIIIVSILAITFRFVDRIIVKRQKSVEAISDLNFPEVSEFSEYMERRARKNFGAALGDDIFVHANEHDAKALRQFCLGIYNHEVGYQLDQEKLGVQAVALTNDFFYEKLGTFDTTETFFDNVDNSLGTRLKLYFSRRAPRVWALVHNFYAIKAHKMLLYLVSIFAYYFDLIKDVLLIILMVKVFKGNGEAGFEVFRGINVQSALLSVAILSIVLALLANVTSVVNFKPWNWTQKLLGALLILFIPGAIRYRIYRIGYNMAKTDKSKVDLLKDRSENQALSGLKAELRCNENSLEQLPQLVLIILLVLIRSSSTVTVPTHFAANLLREDQDYILIGSAIWSFVSLTRGQMSLGFSISRGIVPLLGKVLLFVYYSIGTFARIFAFVLFFTPNLGLLNTRHHSLSGILCAEMDVGVFDIENGNVTFFGQLWNNDAAGYTLGESCEVSGDAGKVAQDFYHFPKEVMVCAVPLMVILHLILSLIFFEAIYFGFGTLKEVNWPRKILQCLHILLCPPVHWDWEVIHRLRGGRLSISECWRRSKRLLIAFNVLFLIEHLLLMVPLMVLKGAINRRNALLSIDFPPTSDEVFSTERVDSLLFFGIFGFAVLPLLSLLLAYIYFRKLHLWSRILNRHVQRPRVWMGVWVRLVRSRFLY